MKRTSSISVALVLTLGALACEDDADDSATLGGEDSGATAAEDTSDESNSEATSDTETAAPAGDSDTAATATDSDESASTDEPTDSADTTQDESNDEPSDTATETETAEVPDGGAADSSETEAPVDDAGAPVDDADGSMPETTDEESVTPAGDSGVPFDGSCATLPGRVVYIESGDTQESLLKNLGQKLRNQSGITLAFNLTGSCTLINDIYTGARMAPNGTLKYIPSTEEDPDWTPSMPPPTCTTAAAGAPIDVAISALFAQSCGLGEPTEESGLSLIQGPIQAYTFIVPEASDQTAIWAEEAYYAFGFGSENPLAPDYNSWNNEELLFVRPPTKSTLVATAKNIALPPNNWLGVQEPASADVLNAVATSADPDATLGILGAEVYDNNRDKGVRTLAFQAFEQDAAYFPDSSSSGFDKQNVRDGHYTLWSPTVYITQTDGEGVPSNETVAEVISQVLGESSAASAGFDGLADVVKVGLIPECAMQVTRSEDGGDLSPYLPAEPCTCYYLSKIPGSAGAPEGCEACTSDSDCDSGDANICSHGFCESATIDGPQLPTEDCFSGAPSEHSELVNACTAADSVVKDVELPSEELEPLP